MSNRKKKAKKATKTAPYSKETFEEISQIFDANITDIPEKQAESIKKHLSVMKDKFDVQSKDVVDVFQEKLGKVKPDAKRRYGTAVKLTRNHFDRESSVSAKPYLAFLIGKQHKVTDINSIRLEDLKAEYEGHVDSHTASDVEISKGDYDTIIAEFYKINAKNEEQARSYVKSALDGRFVVYTEVAEGEQPVEDDFIENMEAWDSGTMNFNYGKIIKPNPSRTYTSVVLENGVANLVDVNVKGEERMEILSAAELFKLVTMKVVKNETEGQRWWVDRAFAISPVDNDFDVLQVRDPIKKGKKLIKYMMDAVPNEIQVLVEDVDSWQRKVQKKIGKDNVLGLVKGTVLDVFYGEEDKVTITLSNDSYDLDDMDIWEEDATELRFRVRISPELADLIDFDMDTVLYVWGEIYRGAFYDPQTREFDEEKKADMPSMNAWGFIADPELKNERVEAAPVSEEDFETASEEDDEGFVIEDD